MMLVVPQRYGYVKQMVRETQPKSILEIGTWRGDRALDMLSEVPHAKYYGFDLFEDATEWTDADEKNVKAHWTMDDVWERLSKYDISLTKGNTRHTLRSFNSPVDFVFIDGGHSLATIRSDWENVRRCLKPSTVVLFDDYYTERADMDKFGCNAVVDSLKHELHPVKDAVSDGGFVQIARVWPT